jgi:hypothetical protein
VLGDQFLLQEKISEADLIALLGLGLLLLLENAMNRHLRDAAHSNEDFPYFLATLVLGHCLLVPF